MKSIKIHPSDNVAVALEPLHAGYSVQGIVLLADIPQGHKFALSPISAGEKIVKYGYPIGHATCYIAPGQWVHTHNIATDLCEDLEYVFAPTANDIARASDQNITFDGYLRDNGTAGIRNELWVIPTVGCVNGQAEAIVRRIKEECVLDGIDDVVAFTHNYGCSQLGDDHACTRAAIAAMTQHPNAGGVLLLGLGCENNQMAQLKQTIGDAISPRMRFLVAQDCGDEIEAGFQACQELLEIMRNDHRQQLPVSMLTIGLKCGGSDGLSGITANPLVGRFSDWLVAHGGTTVLTEVPEMFGAETILMNRCVDHKVFDKTVDLINGFKDYFRQSGQPIYENPSPGNKAGGITTLEEKSLGCVQKGGSATVVDVLSYAQQAKNHGLNLLWSPGNDLVAATALALSGCQMVLFTTGRGTPFGTCVPTMKIATNSALAGHKPHWIDFDAGVLVNGADNDTVLHDLIDKVLAVASGTHLQHEKTHAKGIAIFKSGVTL